MGVVKKASGTRMGSRRRKNNISFLRRDRGEYARRRRSRSGLTEKWYRFWDVQPGRQKLCDAKGIAFSRNAVSPSPEQAPIWGRARGISSKRGAKKLESGECGEMGGQGNCESFCRFDGERGKETSRHLLVGVGSWSPSRAQRQKKKATHLKKGLWAQTGC